MTTTFADPVGLPAKPTGPGHSSNGRICHHWAIYRLTCMQYECLREWAAGLCGICKTPESQTPRGYLVVDHFHGVNGGAFVRGMLCDWCNASVMQCIDGLRVWGPRNRPFEAAAREYERHSWQRPSDEALLQMAARTEKLPKYRRPTPAGGCVREAL